MCKFFKKEANEFEKTKYSLYKVVEVGKKHYKLMYSKYKIITVWKISTFNDDNNVIVECPDYLKGE